MESRNANSIASSIKELLARFETKILCFESKLIQNITFHTSFALIILIASIFIISNIGFILKIGIQNIYICVALIISLFVLMHKNTFKKESFFVFTLVLIISLLAAKLLFDHSWDGRSYHQIAIYYLANGWNPIYEKMQDLSNLQNFLSHEIWIEHYLKLSEITAANIYAFTNDIESGKAINYILAFASLLYSISVLSKNIDIFSAILLSIPLAFSPVALMQISTYYVDGLLSSALLLIFLSIIGIESSVESRKENKKQYIIFIFSMLFASSIKLSGLGYSLFIGIMYLAYKIIFAKSPKSIFISGVIIALLITLTNINPLITNMLNGKHAGYPLLGKDKIDIITPNEPINFHELKRHEKLIISLFSKTQNTISTPSTLKIPFFKSKDEYMGDPDTRVAGFGPYFSGILILCFFMFLLHYKRLLRSPFVLSLILLCGSVYINPESWWARYAPQLWLLPFIFVVFSYRFKPRFFSSYLRIFIIILLYLNLNYVFKNAKNGALNFTTGIEKYFQTLPKNMYLYFEDSMEKSFLIKLNKRGFETKLIEKEEFLKLENLNWQKMQFSISKIYFAPKIKEGENND